MVSPLGDAAMLRISLGALVMAVLLIGPAQAQVTGPIPNTQQDDSVRWTVLSISRAKNPEDAGREHDIEQKYQETLRTKIPDKKPASKDPWRNIRQAPTAAAPDRHKVY